MMERGEVRHGIGNVLDIRRGVGAVPNSECVGIVDDDRGLFPSVAVSIATTTRTQVNNNNGNGSRTRSDNGNGNRDTQTTSQQATPPPCWMPKTIQ